MTTLFISDLHLSGERPQIIELFLEFLDRKAATAETLYILGDLFEVWVGDDVVMPDIAPVLEGLRKLTASGIPVYVMVGNRDFLLGEDFQQQTGCQLIEDPCQIDLYGKSTLLMHGDTLCTDDLEYQEARRMVRDPQWQKDFLAKSVDDRIEFARKAREKSKAYTSEAPEEIMDVNSQTLKKILEESRVDYLIHGHTHRPAIHDVALNERQARRIVLGDWYSQQSVLSIDASGFELTGFKQQPW